MFWLINNYNKKNWYTLLTKGVYVLKRQDLKGGLVALLGLSSSCLVVVVWLFLAVQWLFSAVCDCGIS